MIKVPVRIALTACLAVLISACATGTPTPQPAMMGTATPEAMMATTTPDAMMQDTATPEAMMATATPGAMMQETATPAAMMGTPGWFGAALTNARSGQAFTINDFKGKVVLVETMAVWCTNCLAQQKEIKALHDKMGMQADFVSVSLDIDPNEKQADLKA